jgi:hypothetical protein
MRFLFNYASRSRPENFFRGVNSIVSQISQENEYTILAVLDEDDATMNNESVIKRMEMLGVDYVFGKSKNKIDAINRECNNFPDFDVLVNMSDDMVFSQVCFDEVITEKITDLDFFFHFRDSNHTKPDALCTLSIMGKDYFDRDGFIYHPDYVSVWCDNFAQDVAKARGKYKFFNEIIFDHRHPAYRKSAMDEQYKRTEDKLVYRNDHRTYRRMLKNLKQYT